MERLPPNQNLTALKGVRVNNYTTVLSLIESEIECGRGQKKTYPQQAISTLLEVYVLMQDGKFDLAATAYSTFAVKNRSPTWHRWDYFRDRIRKHLSTDIICSALYYDGALYVSYIEFYHTLSEYLLIDPDCEHGKWGLSDLERLVECGIPSMQPPKPPLYVQKYFCKHMLPRKHPTPSGKYTEKIRFSLTFRFPT